MGSGIAAGSKDIHRGSLSGMDGNLKTLDVLPARRSPLCPRSPVHVAMFLAGVFCLVKLTTGGSTDIALQTTVIFLLPIFTVWCLAHWPTCDRLLRAALTRQDHRSATNRSCWPWIGMVMMLTSITLLECLQPLYFTQDDSLANGVVGMVVGGRSFFAGQFPVWNHCQYLGAPMASMSYWSLTYPPTYLCYLIATYGLGNEWWTMEVYQVLHLMASYGLIYWAARVAGLRQATATIAAISVALAGTSLIVGRCWYATIPLNVWLPLLVMGICQIWRGPVSWKWTIGNGLAMGMLFHVGYPQTWVYAMMTFLGCIVLLWILEEIPLRRALRVIPAQLIGIAFASPLLLVLLQETRHCNVQRYGHGLGAGGILAMIVPYPLIQVPHPEHWGNHYLEMMGQMYYLGSLIPFLALAGIASLVALRHNRQTLVDNFWLLIAACWLLVSLGYRGAIWILMGMLPGFSNFSCPFKAQQLFNLFAALAAGLLIDRAMRSLTSAATRHDRMERILVFAVLGLMSYHCWIARASFHDYGFTPYPPLPAAYEEIRNSQQRVFVVAPHRPRDSTFPQSLQLSSATVYGIPAVAGYDPLVEFDTGTAEIIRNVEQLENGWELYGVRWVIVHRTALELPEEDELRGAEQQNQTEPRLADEIQRRLERRKASIFYQDTAVTIYELPDPEPMAFAGTQKKPLLIDTDGGGLRVDTTSLAGDVGPATVTINYARRPFIRGFAGGQPIDVGKDSFGRMIVEVSHGCEEILIRYQPPWHHGLFVGLLLLVAAAVGNRCCE